MADQTNGTAIGVGSMRVTSNGSLSYSDRRDAEGDDVSLRELLEILAKGRWIVLGTLVLLLAATAAYTFATAPKYEGTSVLLINRDQTNPQLSDLLGLEFDNRNISNEVEILKSRTIALRVAERLGAWAAVDASEPLTVLAREEDEDRLTTGVIAERLRREFIRIRPLARDVDLIEVVATSRLPAEAALIANLYAEEFVDYNRSFSRSRARASREFLSEVTDRFQGDLVRAEEEVTAFLDDEHVVAPDEEARQLIEQVMQWQQLQYQTQYELGAAQAELSALEAEVEQVVPGLVQKISSGDGLMIDHLVEQIAIVELQVEQKYARNPALRGDPSPDRELERQLAEIESLKRELDARANRLVDDAVRAGGLQAAASGSGGASSRDQLSALQELRRQIMEKQIAMTGLRARLDVVDEQLARSRTLLGDMPRKEVILNRLERSLETREQLYVALVEKLQEARIAEQSELGYVEIIDEAVVPAEPVRPRVPLNLTLGAVLGLLLGIGLAFVRNAVDNKVRKPEELRRSGLSVLAVIPGMERLIDAEYGGNEYVTVEGRRYSTTLVTLLDPLSAVAEGYRHLCTNIRFSHPDAGVRSVLVTSPEPGDGKTVTALNLAIAQAQTGRRVVYIDADLRRSEGHDRFGIPRTPGLVDLLFEEEEAELERFATAVDGLYVIPAGTRVPNPAEVLESKRLQQLLVRLQREVDLVVVDSTPVLAVADALGLSALCDATLLVCSASRTTWPVLERSVEALNDVRSKVTGVVLNRFDPRRAYGMYVYGNPYGYGYTERREAGKEVDERVDERVGEGVDAEAKSRRWRLW